MAVLRSALAMLLLALAAGCSKGLYPGEQVPLSKNVQQVWISSSSGSLYVVTLDDGSRCAVLNKGVAIDCDWARR